MPLNKKTNQPTIHIKGSPHGVVANTLDFDVSLNSSHTVAFTFGLMPFEKGMNTLILSVMS